MKHVSIWLSYKILVQKPMCIEKKWLTDNGRSISNTSSRHRTFQRRLHTGSFYKTRFDDVAESAPMS
jgi:hypothetical protein